MIWNCFSNKGNRYIKGDNRVLRITVGPKGGSKGTAMEIVIICGLHQATKSRSTT